MARSLERCAVEYGRYWLRNERELVADVTSGDRARALDGLQRAVHYFRIARTMQTRYDVARGLDRLAPALTVLRKPRYRRVTPAVVHDSVRRLRRDLGSAYGGRDLLAPATKLLWMFHPHCVVIYDSLARAALGTRVGDYDAYLAKWRAAYAEHAAPIRDACRTLAATDRRLRAAAATEWFRMRAFDVYLWHRGRGIAKLR